MNFPQVRIKNYKHSKTATITKTDDSEKFLQLPQSQIMIPKIDWFVASETSHTLLFATY